MPTAHHRNGRRRLASRLGEWTERDIPDLNGKTAVVTGANRGLGREVARHLMAHGARVVVACRDEPAGEATVAALQAEGLTGPAEVRSLDLADLASVEKFADGLAGEPRLDLLVNNAGVMAIPLARTVDGFETHIGVNYLGHFALTARLLPLLLATSGSRVVTMSSIGARLCRPDLDDLLWERRPYDRMQAYFQSKLANLLFTVECDRRLRAAQGTTSALAAHPGGVNTGLGMHGQHWTNRALTLGSVFAQPMSLGVLGCLRAATDPSAQGGQYYGPRFQFWGYPVRETPPRRARDPELAASLWRRSEELTGCSPDFGSMAP